jgi:serine 3-dehydrogenase (NADP+)
MNSLSGKTAIVTGASAGIGEATARLLAKAGARVLLVARREERLRMLAEDIGCGACFFALDLAQADAAQALLDAAVAQLGTVDILINNAGILRTSHVDAFDLAELEPMIAINYSAVVRTSTLFARHMKANGSGQIINLSSIGASLTAAGTGIYGGLKMALDRFTDVLRIELAGSGVRVGQVAPGTTTTENISRRWCQTISPAPSYSCVSRPAMRTRRGCTFMRRRRGFREVAVLVGYCSLRPRNKEPNVGLNETGSAGMNPKSGR